MIKAFLCLLCVPMFEIANPPVAALAQTTENSPALDAHQKLARDIFQELIEINTTLTAGSTRAAEAMAVRLTEPENSRGTYRTRRGGESPRFCHFVAGSFSLLPTPPVS